MLSLIRQYPAASLPVGVRSVGTHTPLPVIEEEQEWVLDLLVPHTPRPMILQTRLLGKPVTAVLPNLPLAISEFQKQSYMVSRCLDVLVGFSSLDDLVTFF